MFKVWEKQWQKTTESSGYDQEKEHDEAEPSARPSPIGSTFTDTGIGMQCVRTNRKRSASNPSTNEIGPSARDSSSGRPVKRRKVHEQTEDNISVLTDTEIVSQSSQQGKQNAGPDHTANMVIFYEPTNAAAETPLYNRLRALDSKNNFNRQYRDARRILSELGTSASDLFWRSWLEETCKDNASRESKETRAAMRGLIEPWTFDMPSIHSSFSASNVTPKLTKLVEILQTCQVYGSLFRGVIVVKRPVIATVLHELLNILDETMDFCHTFNVIGPTSFNSPQHQREVLDAFAAGTYNLLIVNKFVDNLDIIQPSIVIWYDVFEKETPLLSWNVRSPENYTHLAYMLEKDNIMHTHILHKCPKPRIKVEIGIHGFTGSQNHTGLPETTPCSSQISVTEDPSLQRPYIQDPVTERKMLPSDAPLAVQQFVESCSQRTSQPTRLSLYQLKELPGQAYTCDVQLPPGFPLNVVSGPTCSSPTEAKDLACYYVCCHLFDRGLLDSSLFSCAPQAGEDDLLPKTAKAASGARCYPRKCSPFWSNSRASTSTFLYPTIVSVGRLRDEYHAPMLIITRMPLPNIAALSVFSSGFGSMAVIRKGAVFEADEDKIRSLHGYTMRIARALTNKPLASTVEEMSYFFAPLNPSWEYVVDPKAEWWDFPSVVGHIPWDSMNAAIERWVIPLVSDDTSIDDAVQDAIIQERWVEFSNRHFVISVRHDLTPLSKAPDGSREAEYGNFVECCKTHRKNFDGLKDYKQPILEVAPVPPLLNSLNPVCKHEVPSSKVPARFLIPELCPKFVIPASTFRTILLLPPIMHRIDDILVMKELNLSFFENAIAEEHLLAAISTTTEGVDVDYERLELLGDSFLKLLTSTYCFVTMPDKREGVLHINRQQIITNKALHAGAVAAELPPFIRSRPFLPKVWQPFYPTQTDTKQPSDVSATGTTMCTPQSGKRKKQDDQSTQWLGDKTIADVVEGLMGAAYLSGGSQCAFKVAKTLKVSIPDIREWTDFERKATIPTPDLVINLSRQTRNSVEEIVGHQFERPVLLAQALTHASLQGQSVTCYDRLEFLGDAVLDFTVTAHLFQRHKHLSPGGLSMLRVAMVSNPALATICVLSGLYEHVQYASVDLANTIHAYADQIRSLRDQEDVIAKAESRLPGQYWLEIEPPKILSDVVESIIGALYVSDSFSTVGVEKFFQKVLLPFYNRHIRLHSLSHHPNKTLSEIFHLEGCVEHQFMKHVDGDIIRCDVIVHDVVLAGAMDTSANMAVRRAAMTALDALEGDSGFMKRLCDCRSRHPGKRAIKKRQQAHSGYGDDDNAMTVESV